MKMLYTLLSILLFSFSVYANATSLQSIKKHLPSGTSYHFSVGGREPINLKSGTVSIPASLAKIFTAEMGLRRLGVNYPFPVQVTWRAQGTSISNLTFISQGAPEFSPESLIRHLKRIGVRQVHGPIVIRGGQHTSKPKDQRQISDSGYCYNAKPSTLNYNKNCISISINSRGAVISDPDLRIMPIQTHINYGTSYNGTAPHFTWNNHAKTEFSYSIQTSLKNHNQSVKVDVLVPNTDEWIKEKISRIGESNGIDFNELSNQKFSNHRSVTLSSGDSSEVICESLKESVNLYAQIVYDLLSNSDKSSFLKGYGSSLIDGSGMSRRNKISATGLVNLLTDISNGRNFNYFLSCLPQPGSGTLDKRLSPLSGKLKAKTGSLSGISHLAGYIKSPKTRNWRPFVFMIRNDGLRVHQLRNIQDAALIDLQKHL